MFGYIRPLKQEMLVRELSRYRAVYCGICKQIGRDYGQLPRMATGYDVTMLALLLLSLDENQPELKMEKCVLNPLRPRPVVRGGDILGACAALAVLLAAGKAQDDVRDQFSLKGGILLGLLYRARRRAGKNFRDSDLLIKNSINKLVQIEKGAPDLAATEVFADMMAGIFRLAAALVTTEAKLIEALGLLGRDIGSWIYLLDAIDDLPADCDNKRWNPLALMQRDEAREYVNSRLVCLEAAIDRTAALLPYQHDSGLIANIVKMGLPYVRKQVFAGNNLPGI